MDSAAKRRPLLLDPWFWMPIGIAVVYTAAGFLAALGAVHMHWIKP